MEIAHVRNEIEPLLQVAGFTLIDANSAITGKDFLLKIWEMIVAVPLGIAVIHKDMPARTLCNIFYELGMAQSLGKEILVVKTKDAVIPSDFVRTEYIVYDQQFEDKFNRYMSGMEDRRNYYELMADTLEKNPLLSIDYLRRAFLLSGDRRYHDRAKSIFEESQLEGRARNSVEALLTQF